MKLKSFKTEIFAGINNRDYEFEDGLNILLGDNEAGKSTIINAIYSSLFTDAQIKLNTTAGIEFKDKFLPYPDGDYSEAELEFEVDNLNYKIYKKWSNSNYAAYLELPDGRRVENPDKIKEYKREILAYPKSTYQNIVFSSQEKIKTTLERINSEENPELVDTISSFLRRTIMELNGISIEKFRSKLDNELDNLLKKWDLQRNAVTNSERGVNNPYKQGAGEIYESYIAKEKLRVKIKNSKINEKKFKDLTLKIKSLKNEEKDILKEIKQMSEIESDINQRAAVELQIKSIENNIDSLAKSAEKWPALTKQLEKIKEKYKSLEKELSQLANEQENSKKLEIKREVKDKIKKIELLNKDIEELKRVKAGFKLDKNQIEKLEKYRDKINSSKAALKAARLKTKINFSADKNIKIITGVDNERIVSEGEVVEADGYIRIKTDQIDLEIESAEIDFSALKDEYKINKEKFNSLLAKLNVENLAEAKEKLRELEEVLRNLETKKEKLNDFLADETLESLKNRFEQLKNIKETRDLKEITLEYEKKKEKLAKLETELKIRESKIKELKDEYTTIENLNNMLNKSKEELAALNKKLNSFSSLPEEYDDNQEFINDLKDKRDRREVLNKELRDKLEEHQEIENSLPEISTKKMELKQQELKNEFEKLKKKAVNLLEIKETFEDNLEKIDQNSFNPLVKSFISNLNFITGGKYNSAVIEDDFSIKISSDLKRRELPAKLDLLSFGTYDAAAIALRFAIFDNLFADYEAFIILDDCLVNLDPERRKNAVELIKKYQEKYQIIYTSCNPAVADDFNAKIINV